jgi:hypothetical protein
MHLSLANRRGPGFDIWSMTMRWILLSGVALTGCAEGPQCDADGLAAALARAEAGEEVRMGACRVEGRFTLPAGAILEGEAGSVIVGRIDLSGGGTVEQLAIESNDAGIVAQDGGAVIVRDVQITASTGIGIAANGVASLVVDSVALRGPVTGANVSTIEGAVPDPMVTATHGIIVENVANAMLSDVSVRGFARFGALFKDSTTIWMRGDANENAWVGVMAAGGTASLSDLEVHDTFDLRIDDASAFGVVTGSAAIDSVRLSVRGSGGFGLFHLRGSASHEDLIANDNASGGVRLELTTAAEISGELADNDFGAIVAFGADGLIVSDAIIRNSLMATRSNGNGATVQAGDGIQLVDSTDGALIENTTVQGNARAGLVIDLFGRTLGAGLFSNVSVGRSDPAQNGVLVQGGTRAADWDTGLMRDLDTVQADEAFTGTVDIVGAVGPCFFPSP